VCCSQLIFWRGSNNDLPAIVEADDDGPKSKASSPDLPAAAAGLPPDAVAVNISSANGPAWPGQEAALLQHAERGLGQVMTPRASPSPARPPPSPPKPPASPPNKLARYRADALEAAGVLPQGGVEVELPGISIAATPRTTSTPPRGTPRGLGRTPHAAPFGTSRLGGEGGEGMRRPSRLPGDDSSREPSVRGGRAHFTARSHRPSLVRTTSMASHRSGAAPPRPGEAPPPAKLLSHQSSSLSSSDSARQIMALRMSKMEKYIRKNQLEVSRGPHRLAAWMAA
jgi:hypothetical protein